MMDCGEGGDDQSLRVEVVREKRVEEEEWR